MAEEKIINIVGLGEYTIASLARMYSVGWTTISHIVKYETCNIN